MPKPVFIEKSTDYLVLSYDIKMLDEEGFGDKLDEVLEDFRPSVEDGERVFDYIEQDAGQVVIKFQQFTPLRVVNMWGNRIEKRLEELSRALNAA
jgi:hypothetical protein